MPSPGKRELTSNGLVMPNGRGDEQDDVNNWPAMDQMLSGTHPSIRLPRLNKRNQLTAADGSPLGGAHRTSDDLKTLGFPYIGRLTGRLLTSGVTATPTSLLSGTEVYIDFNRGNDANPGTRSQPKKNLSVLNNANYGAGSVIALASDSEWIVNAHVNCANIKGASGNPVIVTAYDPAGHSGTKPRISYRFATVAGDWTYDAGRNGWRYNAPNYVGPMTAVFFGSALLHGLRIWQDTNQPAFTADLQFGARTDYSTYSEIWVYAPAGTNPVDYYGGVTVCPAHRGMFYTSWDGMIYTEFDGLEFFDSAVGIAAAPASSAPGHAGLVVKNCTAKRSNLLEFASSSTNAHSFQAFDNIGQDLPSSFVKFGGQGTFTADVTRNSVDGCNVQYGAQAAFYVQAVAATLGDVKVHRNYIKGAINGTGSEIGVGYGCPFDGAAIYADLGANRVLFYANVMERCGKPIQTNSARTVQVISNVMIDCELVSSHTDAGNVGNNNVTFAHNTWVSSLPVGTLKIGRSAGSQSGVATWFESSTGGNTLRMINNALISSFTRTGVAMRVAAEAATQTVAGNAIAGWSNAQGLVQERALLNGTVTDRTAAAAVITSGTVESWFEAGVTPGLTSPLNSAGSRALAGLKDLNGDDFERFPTIGAVAAAV